MEPLLLRLVLKLDWSSIHLNSSLKICQLSVKEAEVSYSFEQHAIYLLVENTLEVSCIHLYKTGSWLIDLLF